MKKYFLDCGANRGQSFKSFIKAVSDSKDYKFVCFEPSKSKRLREKIKNNIEDYQKKGYDIEYHNKAIYTYNGTVEFYDMGNESSTTEKEKQAIKSSSKIDVECIDLAEYILNLPKDAYVELKLDIEGGEYDVIKHLYSTSALKKVDKVYLEPHAVKIKGRKIEDDFKLIEQLADFKIESYTWNGNKQPPAGSVWTKEKVIKLWKRKGKY